MGDAMAVTVPAGSSLDADIAFVEALLNGPESGLLAWMTGQRDIASVSEARALLADILAGLRSARDEPLWTTEQMMVDLDRRARARRDAA